MHVLVCAPFALSEYHFETDLEIAQRHLDQGDRVTVAVCNADLLTCDVNPTHEAGLCTRCMGRHLEGLSRLSPKADVVSLMRLSEADRGELRRIDVDRMDTIEDLRSLTVENFDLGWGVLSSLITRTQGKALEFRQFRQDIRAGLISALAIYRSVHRLLGDLGIDRVYAFNGRFATLRAVLRAAQSKGVDCFIHERGSTFEKYSLFENHLPHEIDYYQDLIRQAWDGADVSVREAIGASFFTDKIIGAMGSWLSFSAKQESGLLPDGWKDGVNNVAVFTSSTDENDAVANLIEGGAYKDQYEALDRIFASIGPDRGIHFYVRIHPRAQSIADPGAVRLQALRLPHVTVIPPGSPVSTYTLMRRATRGLTLGSTTGIETAYWGKPSILGLRTYYDRLGSTYNPSSHDEMLKLLVAPDLKPLDRAGALMYGYFQKTFGVPFRHFRPLGLYGGSFKGTPLKPSLAFRTAGWLLDRSPARTTLNRVHLKLAERRLLAR